MSGVKNSTGFGKEKIGVTHTESGFPQTENKRGYQRERQGMDKLGGWD